MKNLIKNLPYALFIPFSLLILLQIIILFKDSYSKEGQIVFIKEEPEIAKELVQENSLNAFHNNLININTSPKTLLESLPKVGPVTAERIIQNRPYNTLEELKTKANLSDSLYFELQTLVTL